MGTDNKLLKSTFWGEVFTDTDNTFSFKRVQTAIFTILFTIAVVGNMFWKLQISDSLLSWLGGLLGAGYTGIAIEKLMNRAKDVPS